MSRPPVRSEEGLLGSLLRRVALLERRRTGAARTSGTTAERDAYFGIPATDAGRAALANERPRWWNFTTGREETYYAVVGTTGLTVPGIIAARGAGWYATPATEWAGRSGPNSYISPWMLGWARGITNAGSTMHTGTENGIRIGVTGDYECRVVVRGGNSSPNDYVALALSGDRSALETQSNNQSIMVGVWNHSHSAAYNNYTESNYLGRLTAGDLLTAGPPDGGTTIQIGSDAFIGSLTVRRIS